MSKKIQSVLSVALILLCGLCLFTSCSTQKLDFFTNIGDSLDPVAKLVRAMHGWIGNYGWTVVVFTVFLKVVMLPLDFWQRYASRKATLDLCGLSHLVVCRAHYYKYIPRDI